MSKNTFSFKDVYKEELKFLLNRRKSLGIYKGKAWRPTGIAISGGGIRSATFSFGFLKLLNKKGLLKYFDYISTVSGGVIQEALFR